jgi:cell division protein FtsQ
VWFGFSWGQQTNLFLMTDVMIRGNNNLSDEVCIEIIKPYIGSKIWSLDLKEISSALESNPFVKAARLSLRFPNTLVIDISERLPIALINIDPLVLIDSESVILPLVKDVFELPLPILSNFNTSSEFYREGKITSSKSVREAAGILKILSTSYPDLYSNISELRLDKDHGYELILESEPTRILLGENEFTSKLLILKEFEALIANHTTLTNYLYLDLRYSNQIIARERSA